MKLTNPSRFWISGASLAIALFVLGQFQAPSDTHVTRDPNIGVTIALLAIYLQVGIAAAGICTSFRLNKK